MATHLPVPKVSVTSTDSGYDSNHQSAANLIHDENKGATVYQQLSGINQEPGQSNLDLHLLSPYGNVQEPHRVRKSSTGSNVSSSYSSDVSTPDSTRPLLPDQPTTKAKRQDLHLLSPHDNTQEQHRVRKSSTSSYSSDVSTPGSTRSLLSDQSTTNSKEKDISQNTDESSRKQAAVEQKSKLLEMTGADEKILCDTVRCEMPTFVNNTDFKMLGSHMLSRNLLHLSDYETLTNMLSDRERGNHLYMQILPHKGEHTYRLFYECLENEKEHMGHRDLIKILDKALNDRHPPRSSFDSASSPTESKHLSDLAKLNYADEIILRETVHHEMPTFVENTDFKTLSSHLYSRKLLHTSDFTTLTSLPSNVERGNCLYMQILPSKGRHTYRRVYECLKIETEHMGHRDLVKLLGEALRKDRSDRTLPQGSSTTDDNEPEKLSTHSQAKLCCYVQ